MRLADGSMVGAITFKDVAGAVRFLSQRLIEHPNGSDPDVIESEEAAIDRQLAAEVAAIDAQLAADLTELDARYAAEVAAMETPEADTPPPAYRDSSQPLARDPSAAV